MALFLEWCRTISKYPARYGRLSSLYLDLLYEASQLGMRESRIQYFHSAIIAIDKPNASVYDEKQLVETKPVEPAPRGIEMEEE